VTNGFANKKFSGSVNKVGINNTITKNSVKAVMKPKASLEE
jgi:hypothetical protein